jgi:hypothetical protein
VSGTARLALEETWVDAWLGSGSFAEQAASTPSASMNETIRNDMW